VIGDTRHYYQHWHPLRLVLRLTPRHVSYGNSGALALLELNRLRHIWYRRDLQAKVVLYLPGTRSLLLIWWKWAQVYCPVSTSESATILTTSGQLGNNVKFDNVLLWHAYSPECILL
jgi:hypothetical protein